LANRIFSASERRPGEDTPPTGSARSAAIRLLSRRDYTTHEIRERLIERGFDAAVVDQTLLDLHQNRLLDDRRVAAAHARAAVVVKGRGRWRVARELEARGISRELAHEAMAELDVNAEGDALKKILVRKRFPAQPSAAERRRMVQHLLRRGFAADAIYRALGRGLGEADDPTED
jgi:regulatory protein